MSTLYLSGVDTAIHLASHHLEICKASGTGEKLTRRLPLHCLDRVAMVGQCRVSMQAVRAFMRRDIPVHVLGRNGHHTGSFCPNRDGDALWRIRQYRNHDSEWALESAKRIVFEKILNARRVLQRVAARDPKTTGDSIADPVAALRELAQRALRANTAATLRGIEGAAAGAYFETIARFFPEGMPFSHRSRRPPRDPVNALLSWTYTLVNAEVRGAVVAAGLDPCIGVYHGIGYGRPSLALDMLEPLRAPLCDMLVLRLVNLGILKPADFSNDPDEGCRLVCEGREKFFEQYEHRMTNPFRLRGEKSDTCFRDLIRRNVAAFAMALRTGVPFAPLPLR